MFKFLFKSKKGSFGKGGGAGGGVCVIGVIIFAICIYPYLSDKFNFKLPNFFSSSSSSSSVSDDSDNSSKSSLDIPSIPDLFGDNKKDSSNSDSSNNESKNDSSNKSSIKELDNFSLDINKAKEMASKIKIAEKDTDSKHDSARSDWENSQKFTTPISKKKTGIKNYTYEVETNLAYNRSNFSFICPYSNEEVNDIKKIDYDHIIPINYVDSHGGWEWDKEKKQEYAYNINNGVCTAQGPNRAKSDKGPSEYMPTFNQKWYCYRWLEIASRYNISLSKADYDIIVKTLGI